MRVLTLALLSVLALALAPPAAATMDPALEAVVPCLALYQAERYEEATACLRPLAEAGIPEAQSSLGWICDQGHGAPQDYAQAVIWYRKAAAQGYAYAQGKLGAMYGTGQGVSRDFVEAYAWLNVVAAQGDEDAVEARNAAASLLSPAGLAWAQERAEAYYQRYVLDVRGAGGER